MSGTAGNDKIYGYGGQDTLVGKNGDDVLAGGAGKDYLKGGNGSDILTGGSAADTFVFSATLRSSNVDQITDFLVQSDTIYLDNAIFKKLGNGSLAQPGALKNGYFTIGDKAKDASDHIVYDKTKGVLYYDADGSGRGEAVAFATIGKDLKMTQADFFVI